MASNMQAEYGDSSIGLVHTSREPVQHRLRHERTRLVKRLADIDEALGILEKQPEVERLLDLL